MTRPLTTLAAAAAAEHDDDSADAAMLATHYAIITLSVSWVAPRHNYCVDKIANQCESSRIGAGTFNPKIGRIRLTFYTPNSHFGLNAL